LGFSFFFWLYNGYYLIPKARRTEAKIPLIPSSPLPLAQSAASS
jgi:hypothetical protein